MGTMTKEQKRKQIENAINFLSPKGWLHWGDMEFFFEGVLYDLSAADLTKIDYIVINKLFIVA